MAKDLAVDRVSIWLFSEDMQFLVCNLLYIQSKNTYSSEESIVTSEYPEYFKALTNNLNITADDVYTNPMTSEFTDTYMRPLGIQSMIDIPLRSKGKVIGIICCEHTGEKRHWTEEEEDYVVSVAEIISMSLEADQRQKAEKSLQEAHQKLDLAFRQLKKNERIIEEQKEKLEVTLRSIGDGVITTDTHGKIILLNKTAEFLTGWTQDEAFGMPINKVFCIVDETTNKKCTSPAENVLKTGKITELAYNTVLISKNKEVRNISDTAAPIRDKDGNIFGVILVFKDTTAQRLTERYLQESEESYRTLFETANDAIFILENGNFIACNAKTEQLFLCRSDQIIGKSPIDFSPPTQPDGKTSKKSAGEKIKLAFKGNPQYFEWEHLRYDGTPFHAEIGLNKIEVKGKLYLQAIVRDITERKNAEGKLKKNENLFRNILEMSNISMSIVSLDGTIEYINRQAIKTFGYPLADIPTMDHWWNLAYPDQIYRKKVIDQWMGKVRNAIAQNHEIERDEYITTCKDGSVKTMIIFGVVVVDKVFVMFEDITDSKKSEADLKQSEERYRNLVELSPNPIIVHTNGIIEYANQACFEVFKTTQRDAIIGKTALDFVHPDFRKFALDRIKESFIQGSNAPLVEEKFITPEGKTIDVEVTAIPFDNNGKKSMLTVFRDITDIKKAQQNLIDSEEKYRTLIDSTDTGFVILDCQGYVLDANQRYVTITGHQSIHEIIGRSVIEWTFESYKKTNSEAIKQCVREGFIRNLEIEYVHPDKNSIPVEISATVIKTENGKQIMSLVTEITQRKLAEKELQKSRMLLRSMIDSLPVWLSATDVDGNYFIANKYYSETFKLPLNLIEGHNFLEFFPKDLGQRHKNLFEECKQSGKCLEFYDENEFEKDRKTYLFGSYTPLFTPSGKIFGVGALAIDVTKQKMAENALKESEELFRSIFFNTTIGKCLVSMDKRFITVNNALCEILGYTAEELQNENFLNFTHPDDIDKSAQWVHGMITGKDNSQSIEKRYIHKNGNIIWAITSATLIKDIEEKPKHFIVQIIDITKRKFAEENLKKFKFIVDNTGEEFYLARPDGSLEYVNQAALNSLGFSYDELIQSGVSGLSTKPFSEEIFKDYFNALKQQDLPAYEAKHKTKDGRLLTKLIKAVYLVIGDKEYICAFANDITESKKVADLIRKSEEKFRLLFTSTSQAVTLNEIILNELGEPIDYRILEANPGFEKHTGLKINDCIGKRALDILPNTEPYWIKTFGEVALTGISKRVENYSRELDRYFDFTIYSPQNGIFAVISEDITDRILEEENRRKHTARLEVLLKLNTMGNKSLNEITDYALEEGIKLTDSESGFLAFIDEKETVISMHSYSRDAMEKCKIKDFHYKFFVNKTALLSEVIRQRKAIISNNYNLETLPRNGYPEGHIPIKRFMSIPVLVGGKIVAIAAVSNKVKPYDDTDGIQLTLLMNGMWSLVQKHRSEAALKRSEEQYRLITENSNDIIVKFGTNGKISFISPICKSLLGYEIADMLGASVFSFFHPDDIPFLRQYQEKLLEQKAPNLIKHRLKKADGSYLWFESSNQIILDADGNITEVVAIIRNISELLKSEQLLKEKEAAELANKAKSEFMANMSHEIRNPLNSIIGLSNSLTREHLDDYQHKIVESIKISSNNLLNILNDVLDFSKIEANKMEVLNINFELRQLVSEIYSLFASSATNKGLTFSYTVEKSLPDYLLGDGIKMKQIIINLISNAIKFTETGGVTLKISEGEKTGQTTVLKIEVTDTGIGIQDKDFNKLFNAFSQLDSSTTKSYAGTGLGLAIVKRYTDLLGGRLDLKSTFGKGSSFYLELPFQISESQVRKTISMEQEINDSSPKPIILLAEDDGINQLYLKGFLTRLGYKVETAFNGLQAVEKYEASHFDIILMDGQMPKMDGFEATRRIRIKEKEKNKSTAIIAITGYAVSGDKEKFLNAGMDDYLTKPIDEQRLISLLEKYSNQILPKNQ